VDGSHLGVPGKRFRIRRVEGDPDTLLLLAHLPAEIREPIPHPDNTLPRPAPIDPTRELPSLSARVFATIEIVTGYDRNIMRAEHDLVADLSIDRIKRRKIMELLEAQKPLQPAQVKKLEHSTLLSEWIITLEDSALNLPVSEAEISELLLQIAQEKTGYSRELLTLDAQLESELGIDSIKQAQIAGQIRKMYPFSLQTGLRIKDFPTLRHWVRFVTAQIPTSPVLPALPEPAPYFSEYRLERFEILYREAPLLLKHPSPSGTNHVRGLHFVLTQNEGAGKDEDQVEHRVASALQKILLENGAASARVIPSPTAFSTDDALTDVVIHLAPIGNLNDDSAQHNRLVLGGLRLVLGYQNRMRSFIAVVDQHLARGIDGGIAGFIRTLGQEWKQLQTKLIGVDRAEALTAPELLAERIYGEIGDLHDSEIALKPSGRTAPYLFRAPLNLNLSPTLALAPNSVVIISGGGGGIGKEIARDLVQNFGIIPVLLGRSTPHSQENYLQCDVTDVDAVYKLGEHLLDKYGGIAGIIHAAGILEDQALATKTEASFLRVYAVKVEGMRNLSELALRSQCQFFCAFSSISGLLGNPGQIDYAAANAAMSSMVNDLRRRRPVMKSFAIAWGAWDKVGMAAQTGISDLLKTAGIGAIEPKEGATAFRNELLFGGQEIEVLLRTLPQAELPLRTSQIPFLNTLLDYSTGNSLDATYLLDLEKDTWLKDHEILGIPVLPATLGIEMMVQAALALFPDACLEGVKGLQIHQAIQITSERPTWVNIRARAGSTQAAQRRLISVSLEVRANHPARLAYTADVEISLVPLPSSASLAPVMEPELSATKEALPQSGIYQPLPYGIPLGPWFHVLDQFSWNRANQAEGRLTPSRHRPTPYHSRPLVCEAAFHTAALLRMKSTRAVLIPKSLGTLRNHYVPESEEGLYVRAIYKQNNLFDLFIFDTHHTVCTEIRDFETFDIRALTQDGNRDELTDLDP
jgi:NAD(P)-dependent dehydrogenase (short-subunit alcohol dehydrogenase family)/acyl carrier protein